jgi:predicted acetyltransferase
MGLEMDLERTSLKMSVHITLAAESEKSVLRNLLQLYLYDFSEFTGEDPGPLGLYEYQYLDLYWIESGRHPFLIYKDGKLAGFVLVHRYNYLTGEPNCWVIAEFFVLRKYRGKRVGEAAALLIFERFPGDWQVAQISTNASATTFWRKMIQRFTQGNYQEVMLESERWHGPVQMFHSSGSQL